MAFSTLITTSTTLGQLVESYWSGYSFKSNEYTEDGVPVLTKGDIKPRGLIEHGGKFVPWDLISSKSIRLTEADDFLVSTRDLTTAANFLGLVSRAPNTPHAVNQGVTVFKVKTNIVDKSYLAYWCESPMFRGHIKGHYAGATQIHIRHADLMAAPVMLPNMSEQRRIASILSAYDDLIENNTRRIAILEEMARRIYEEWFVHFRFPGHEQVKMVESELGLIPEGWKIQPLGKVSAINEKSIRPASAPEEILYIDIASVVPGVITQKQPYVFSEAPGRARRVVQHGDVIWSCVRPNRRSYALVLQPEPCLIASTGFAVLTAKALPYSYLYFSVTTDNFVSFLSNHATGAAYPAVSASTFEAAQVLVPKEEVLNQFHSITAPMLDLSETLKRKNTNLRATRDLLLPKLISGELDVSTLPEFATLTAPEEAIAA